MPFKKSKPKAGRVVRHKLADGTTKEYRYPPHKAPRTPKNAQDTVAALSSAWRRSPEWAALAERTKAAYFRYLKQLERLAAVPVRDIRRKHILAIRDAIATARGPAAAQAFTKVCATVFAWAVERDWIDASPCHRIKSLPGGEFPAWTEQDVTHALKHLPEHLRRVVVLAMHTGQRRADLCAMTRFQVQDGTIRLKQQKTGENLVLTIHPDLAAELATWIGEGRGTHLLLNASGEPWRPQWLSDAMTGAMRRIGARPGLNIHGLRKLAASRLAEAGCTAHEIAAVTGHRTLAMVQHYTRSASQQKLAAAAVVRLQIANEQKPTNRRKPLKER